MTRGRRYDLGDVSVIGLPRALLFYDLYPFWLVFFREMGLRTLVSPPTSRDTVLAGARQAVDEACLPVKAFYGHVMALREQVDVVFLPRIVSIQAGTYTCPKLLGLPDMIRHNVRRLPRILVVDFDETKGLSLSRSAARLATRLGHGFGRARAAAAEAAQALHRYREALSAGLPFEKAVRRATEGDASPSGAGRDRAGVPATNGRLRVGLIGHAYNLFDRGMNLGLWSKLERLGCHILTSEVLSEAEVSRESRRRSKEIFWSSGRRIMAAVTSFARDGLVDGLIHLESFGCGPDSIVGEMAERETRRNSTLPYMALTLDEHTGEAGLLTRLEAFVDMLEWRRRGRTRS